MGHKRTGEKKKGEINQNCHLIYRKQTNQATSIHNAILQYRKGTIIYDKTFMR